MIKKIYIFILTLNICLGFSLHAEESKNDITKITSDGSIKLFQNEKAIIRIDMSELMESHSVSKLIGSPTG